MLELGWFSLRLFLKGKLLRSPGYFFRQTFIACGIGTLLMVLLSLPPIPICIPITISSLATGIIMPIFLQDFRMK